MNTHYVITAIDAITYEPTTVTWAATEELGRVLADSFYQDYPYEYAAVLLEQSEKKELEGPYHYQIGPWNNGIHLVPNA